MGNLHSTELSYLLLNMFRIKLKSCLNDSLKYSSWVISMFILKTVSIYSFSSVSSLQIFISLKKQVLNAHVVASRICLLLHLWYSLCLIILFMCISHLKAKAYIADYWSLWNDYNYSDIKDQTSKKSVATVTAVLVCTKLLHSPVSKSRVKREFVKVETSGNGGIWNNFPIWQKSGYSPWNFTGRVGPLCPEIRRTKYRYSDSKLADEGRKASC